MNFFSVTGSLAKKKRGKIVLNKTNAKSKDRLYHNMDINLLNKKKSALKNRDKSNHKYYNKM